MKLRGEEETRPSGIPWVGVIPAHWEVKRANFLVSLAQRQTRESDGIVTAFRDGQVTLRSNRRSDGFTNAVKETGYQGVQKGDLVIHAMDAFAGAVGVSDSDGKCTPVYSCCVPNTKATSEFYARCVRTMATTGFIESLSKGVRERSTDFRWATFAEQVLPVPPLNEQRELSAFMDRETRRIDALIAKKTRLIELLREEVVSRATICQASDGTRVIRLRHVSDSVSRPVDITNGESYTKLGLYNRGRGIFKKDPRDTEEMGDSSFCWVENGDLILSGQFAWEGAVAMARSEHAGCVVSHRFPILRGRSGEALSEYLFAYFLTTHGGMVLNDSSRGSAGRNRPLNMGLLMNW